MWQTQLIVYVIVHIVEVTEKTQPKYHSNADESKSARQVTTVLLLDMQIIQEPGEVR